MCKYCEINPKTKLGRDYYRDDYVDPDEIKETDGNDGIEFTYIDCNSNPALIIFHPDPEYYSQEVAEDLKKSYNHVEKMSAYIVITD